MKKKGSALIYAILISVPVMIIAVALLSYTSGDMRISTYTIKSKQAFYNAESGIEYARAKFEKNHEFNPDTPYYLDYNKTNTNGNDIYLSSDPKNNNDAGLTVESKGNGLQITSIGNYMGISKTVIRYVKLNTNNGVFNLKRKFNIGNLICDSGNSINFFTKGGNGANLIPVDQRFLLLDPNNSDDISNNNNIILSKSNGNTHGLKDTDNFIQIANSKYSLPDIDSDCDRNTWINYDSNVQYYITEGTEGTADLHSICDGFTANKVNVIIADCNLTINNDAVQYLNNTVIYCKGTIILNSCQIGAPSQGNGQGNDYKVCFISDSIEISKDVTFKYYAGNDNTDIISNQSSILNILSNNIKSDIDWE